MIDLYLTEQLLDALKKAGYTDVVISNNGIYCFFESEPICHHFTENQPALWSIVDYFSIGPGSGWKTGNCHYNSILPGILPELVFTLKNG